MEIKEMIALARAAQKEYQERFNQDTVDEVVKAATKVVYDRAELLARMAIDETQIKLVKLVINLCNLWLNLNAER